MRSDNQAYQQIIAAAKAKNVALLPEGVPIDIRKLGDCDLTPAGELASQNNREAVESLLAQGAQINFVAYDAARGGHQTYAEALLDRGADINYVAEGAAQGGHQDFAESLIGRGALINMVAMGAAEGGHLGNDKLIVRWLSHGTAQIQLGQWIEALSGQGKSPYSNKPFSKQFPKQLERRIQINHALMHARVLRGMPRNDLKFNYYESCLLSDANEQYAGGLFLLRAVLALPSFEHLSQSIEPDVPFPTLPTELWLLILSMSFDTAPQQLAAFGKKLQLATVASRSDVGYAGLFPKVRLFPLYSEHPFLQSGESKRENNFCTVQ
jgi:hypothetical protein